MPMTDELTLLVESSRERGLSITQLLELQSNISALRYTMGEEVARAEGRMMAEKDRLELYMVRGKLSLQAQNNKLSSTKADDMVLDWVETEAMRQSYIRSKVEHTSLKLRLDTSGDVLVSIAQRIKRLENEEMTSRFQSSR
jgi:hypothetical protein